MVGLAHGLAGLLQEHLDGLLWELLLLDERLEVVFKGVAEVHFVLEEVDYALNDRGLVRWLERSGLEVKSFLRVEQVVRAFVLEHGKVLVLAILVLLGAVVLQSAFAFQLLLFFLPFSVVVWGAFIFFNLFFDKLLHPLSLMLLHPQLGISLQDFAFHQPTLLVEGV